MKKVVKKLGQLFSKKEKKEQPYFSNIKLTTPLINIVSKLEEYVNPYVKYGLIPDDDAVRHKFTQHNPVFNGVHAGIFLSEQNWIPTMGGFLKLNTTYLAKNLEDAFIKECYSLKLCPINTSIRLQQYFHNQRLNVDRSSSRWRDVFFATIVKHNNGDLNSLNNIRL